MKRIGLAGLGVACVLLAGCARRVPLPSIPGFKPRAPKEAKSAIPTFTEETFTQKPLRSYPIPTPRPGKTPVQTVIGEMGTHTIRQGETLLDVARYYDLGLNEIQDANPNIDIWLAKKGTKVVVPTQWVLPCCTYEGMIVNVPEMRMYYYQRAPGDPGTTIVRTYPLGLGRDDRRTPNGSFTVYGKTVNPTWNIPPRIRQDHIREDGDHRSSIPGGHHDNPLGKYRFELSLQPYRIHGTNIPWGIGMTVSNGCARLYPEDVEHLFPLVSTGTKGAFIYQPVKVGMRDGRVYVEAHQDLYKRGSRMPAGAASTLRAAGLDPSDQRVAAILREARGVPKPVDGGSELQRAAKL